MLYQAFVSQEVGETMHDQDVVFLPHIAIQVFAETPQVMAMVEEASQDRRMARAQVRLQAGGIAAAIEAYRNAPTPNVIVIETLSESTHLLSHLDELSKSCDEGTRVLVIGQVNDVLLYRDLIRRGVSDYLVAPITAMGFIQALSDIYKHGRAGVIGKTVAVVGARGGVGSSTLCHNVGYAMSKTLEISTALVDFDLAFGTVGLDFNQDQAQGVLEAISDPARIDANMIERLYQRVNPKLALMTAPLNLDRTYDFGAENFDVASAALRESASFVLLDVPHQWAAWTRATLAGADEIVIVSEPDLAGLRNTKMLIDALVMLRPNDSRPHVVLNKVGMAKRPEIAVSDFERAVDCSLLGMFPFDPLLFGAASNNGQMIGEIVQKSKVVDTFVDMAKILSGRQERRVDKKGLIDQLRDKVSTLRPSKPRAA